MLKPPTFGLNHCSIKCKWWRAVKCTTVTGSIGRCWDACGLSGNNLLDPFHSEDKKQLHKCIKPGDDLLPWDGLTVTHYQFPLFSVMRWHGTTHNEICSLSLFFFFFQTHFQPPAKIIIKAFLDSDVNTQRIKRGQSSCSVFRPLTTTKQMFLIFPSQSIPDLFFLKVLTRKLSQLWASTWLQSLQYNPPTHLRTSIFVQQLTSHKTYVSG